MTLLLGGVVLSSTSEKCLWYCLWHNVKIKTLIKRNLNLSFLIDDSVDDPSSD